MDYDYEYGSLCECRHHFGSFGQVRCVSCELMGAAKMAHWPKLALWNMNGSCSMLVRESNSCSLMEVKAKFFASIRGKIEQPWASSERAALCLLPKEPSCWWLWKVGGCARQIPRQSHFRPTEATVFTHLLNALEVYTWWITTFLELTNIFHFHAGC